MQFLSSDVLETQEYGEHLPLFLQVCTYTVEMILEGLLFLPLWVPIQEPFFPSQTRGEGGVSGFPMLLFLISFHPATKESSGLQPPWGQVMSSCVDPFDFPVTLLESSNLTLIN